MKCKKLGKSSLMISEIGLGCMSLLKGSYSEANSIVSAAVDAGINFFDTADLYDKGANEKLIGQLLKPIRKSIFLATKVGNQWNDDNSGWNWNPRKSYIVEAVNQSLSRLQTDCIDLYQLHGGTINDPIDETIEAFDMLVQQGKIRYYGISSIRPNVIRKYATLSNIQSVMIQYSLLDRRPEEEIVELLQSQQIGVLARGVLAQGLLTSKPGREYLGYTKEEVEQLQKELSQYGNNASLALHFVLHNPAITSAIVGISTKHQLKDLLKAYSIGENTKILSSITTILTPKCYTDHRK